MVEGALAYIRYLGSRNTVIKDVGAIPRWYKSYDESQKLYSELGNNSGKTKREKLGL
jgi:hypothetical protein